MHQLTIFDILDIIHTDSRASNSPTLPSPSEKDIAFVGDFSPSKFREQIKNNTPQTAPEQSRFREQLPKQPKQLSIQWVEEYWVPRNDKKYWYYRYCYMEGRKIHHIHINGGNVTKTAAKAKKTAVETAITQGKTPTEIKKLIISC